MNRNHNSNCFWVNLKNSYTGMEKIHRTFYDSFEFKCRARMCSRFFEMRENRLTFFIKYKFLSLSHKYCTERIRSLFIQAIISKTWLANISSILSSKKDCEQENHFQLQSTIQSIKEPPNQKFNAFRNDSTTFFELNRIAKVKILTQKRKKIRKMLFISQNFKTNELITMKIVVVLQFCVPFSSKYDVLSRKTVGREK